MTSSTLKLSEREAELLMFIGTENNKARVEAVMTEMFPGWQTWETLRIAPTMLGVARMLKAADAVDDKRK